MSYEDMWKYLKEQYTKRKEDLENRDWKGSIAWQIANDTLEKMREIEEIANIK